MKQEEDKEYILKIEDIAEDGKGVAKVDKWVFFVEKGVPGDTILAKDIRKKRKFFEAKIKTIIEPSIHRTEPVCTHFGICGGCKWQQMSYDAQLHFKQKSVVDALERIGSIDTKSICDIIPSANTLFYRNKLEFTFSNKRWLTLLNDSNEIDMNALGFHVPSRFDKILHLEKCYLQRDPSNKIRNAINEFAKENQISYYDLREHCGSLRNLIIRTSSNGEIMVVVVFAYPNEKELSLLMEYIKNTFPEITSLMYVINQKKNDTLYDQEILCYHGSEHIFEQLKNPEQETLSFKVSPKSFFQTNTQQTEVLYHTIWKLANLQGNELVYDLYTGTGTIANYIAKYAKYVIGLEYVEDAIEDAKINSKLNNIHNTEFHAGDIKDLLTENFVANKNIPDVIITDPPRAGMHPKVVESLLKIGAKKIIYVSCNAATQARDLALLKERYDIATIQPVDMFPHTQHVENVVLLHLR